MAQALAPSQTPGPHSSSTSVSGAYTVHVPAAVGSAQPSQLPLHAVSQHTSSAQKSLAHSAARSHVAPFAPRQTPLPSQACVRWSPHGVATGAGTSSHEPVAVQSNARHSGGTPQSAELWQPPLPPPPDSPAPAPPAERFPPSS